MLATIELFDRDSKRWTCGRRAHGGSCSILSVIFKDQRWVAECAHGGCAGPARTPPAAVDIDDGLADCACNSTLHLIQCRQVSCVTSFPIGLIATPGLGWAARINRPHARVSCPRRVWPLLAYPPCHVPRSILATPMPAVNGTSGSCGGDSSCTAPRPRRLDESA